MTKHTSAVGIIVKLADRIEISCVGSNTNLSFGSSRRTLLVRGPQKQLLSRPRGESSLISAVLQPTQ